MFMTLWGSIVWGRDLCKFCNSEICLIVIFTVSPGVNDFGMGKDFIKLLCEGDNIAEIEGSVVKSNAKGEYFANLDSVVAVFVGFNYRPFLYCTDSNCTNLRGYNFEKCNCTLLTEIKGAYI